MYDFISCIGVIVSPEFEGSAFVNDPDDPGGATRYGIIQQRYDEYRLSIKQSERSVELIEIPEIHAIYYSMFWLPSGCDKILTSPKDKLALVQFNNAVQRGPGNAVTMLQHVYNISPTTGVFGVKTTEMLSICHEPSTVFLLLNAMRSHFEDRVTKHPSQAKFLGGWKNRLNKLSHLVGSTWEYDVIKNAEDGNV